MFNWKTLALLVALLATAIGPARADEATDFLASVKAQTSAAKKDLEKAQTQAKKDLEKAKQVALETRAACDDFVKVVEELKMAEAEAQKHARALELAQAEAAKLQEAARVHKVQVRRDRIFLPEGPAPMPQDLTTVDEQPWVTRARVVETCKVLIAKPVDASQPPLLQPGDPMLRGKK